MGIEESTQTPYLVMEMVEGQSLEKILSTKGSIPFSTACEWAGHVAAALAVAHRRVVIHGDIKPANILITTENRVKLTDFGMARLASHQTDSAVRGTPAYWCPEQILGRAQDARSDLFSLGVVLHEMLTGINPFAGDSIPAVCNLVLSSTPLPPSRSNPSVPATLDDILASCLAKEPQLRISSAETLSEQLFPFARRHPAAVQSIAASEPSLRSRASRLLRSA
jgi:serine/threonine-protein kinase